MNKIFKIVFNAARGKMMVVNEATSSIQTGKKAAVTVAVIGALVCGANVASANAVSDSKYTPNVLQEATTIDGYVTHGANVTVNGVPMTGSEGYSTTKSYLHVDLNGNTLTFNNGFGDEGFLHSGHETRECLTGFAFTGSKEGSKLIVTGENMGIYGFGSIDVETLEVIMDGKYTIHAQGLKNDPANAVLTKLPDFDFVTNINAKSVYLKSKGNNVVQVDNAAGKNNIGGKVAFGSEANRIGSMTIDASEGLRAIRVTGTDDFVKIYANELNIIRSEASPDSSIKADGNSSIIIDALAATVDSDIETDSNGSIEMTLGENSVFNGKITAKGDSNISLEAGTVTSTSKTNTAVRLDNSNLEITADKAVITSETNWYGLRAKQSTATIDADVVEVASQYVGVYAEQGSNVTLGNDKSTSVKIDVTSKGEDATVVGLWANYKDSNITVKGKQLEIAVTGAEGVQASGILAQGQAEGNKVVINTEKTVITATDNGIFATGKGQVDVNGHLTVTAADAIAVRGESTVNVNQAGGKDVVLNGGINFAMGKKSGTDAWGNVNLKLDTANSLWNGSLVASWNVEDEYAATPEDFTGSKLNLTLANGAQWTPNAEDKATIEGTQGASRLAVNTLALNEGVINLKDGVEADVTTMSGSGTVNVGTTDGATTAALNVEGAAADSVLNVNIMNADLTAELNADQITEEQAKAVMAKVGGEAVSTTTAVAEGMYNGAMNIGADGTVATTTNSVMSNTLDLASAAPLAMNRLLMNDVRKRMGDLRSAEGTHGVWARYDGGKLSGANSLENDFTTVQVGIDTIPVVDAPRFGVAFAYTQSDADMKRGGAEMDAFSLAFYGTKFYDNGMFVDVIGRMATADTDVTVDGDKKGSMDNVALSLSGELGWRFDVTEKFYFEPQAELTYTYVNADKLDLSGSVYEFDSVDSLMGRVGFAAGFKCPNNFGDVYVRASAVHEFLGDAAVTGANGTSLPVDGEDTWVEFGLGANFNVNKSTYVYVDIERTEGAKLEEDWRANVGVRYAF